MQYFTIVSVPIRGLFFLAIADLAEEYGLEGKDSFRPHQGIIFFSKRLYYP